MSLLAVSSVGAYGVLALLGAAISALIVGGFNYPLWIDYSARPGARALRIGVCMGGLPWAVAFFVATAVRDFNAVDEDVLLPWAVVLSLLGLLVSPLVSTATRGPKIRILAQRSGADRHVCVNPACRHVNRSGARFCAQCGARLHCA